MAILRFTLQNRITSLMIISVIFLISIFTIVQINSQISNLNRYNTYQARLSSFIVKNNLDAALKQVQGQEATSYIQSNLKDLKNTNVIREATVFNRNGKIVAATDERLIGEDVLYKDVNKIGEMEDLSKAKKWLMADIDRAGQRIDTYIAIRSEDSEGIAYIAKLSLSLGNVQEALTDVYKPILLTTSIVILAIILLGYALSKRVVGPIRILNAVTKIIAAGDLSVRTNIRTEDELEELGKTFNYMTEELIKMKERAENANPLTKLPGNIVIHEQVENRIRENKKFTVIYCDLDNFKSFNDKYGINKGDDAIKLTADVFKDAAKKCGNADDFIGHEGGDDFILLTTPDKAQAVADYITAEFDKRVRALYTKEDLDIGYIVAHARDGTIKKFPIMTISLAGVSNEIRKITSYAEVTNIAAEVKKKAKCIEKSCFVLDKRTDR